MVDPRIYFMPRRRLAIEAAIVAALAPGERAESGPIPVRTVTNVVLRHFPWANRVETHRALFRMVDDGRVREVVSPGRSLPSYLLA